MRHFPILDFFLGGGGRESKLSIMIATLERIEWNSNPPIPIPQKTRIRHVKAKTCHLFGGDGGGGGGGGGGNLMFRSIFITA